MTIGCEKTLGSKQHYFSRDLEEEVGFTSPKVLLSAPFSEIKTESTVFIQSVHLVLTTDCELIVLRKPTEKCNRHTLLRRHKLNQTEFTMHSFASNSFTAIVPDTVLKYSYQVYGTPSASINDWLLKIWQTKTKSFKKTTKQGSAERNATTTGQTTNYQTTEESVNSYSSPTHPIQRQVTAKHPLMNGHSSKNIEQMPSGLIKARSFQERGSSKRPIQRSNSSTSDLDSRRKSSTPEDEPRTPSPNDSNPFESRLRHTQVRKNKRVFSPRFNRSNSTNPQLEERSYYSRSANSTPIPGLSTSIVIPSPAAMESEMHLTSRSYISGGTLPRSRKAKERFVSTSEANQGSPNKLSGKSPKILRIFHRRWQSSSAIKVPLNNDSEEQPSNEPPKKLYQYSAKEVAEQLSFLDAELLRKIAPEELENGAWMKKDTKDKLAPNVMAMVRSFNQLALLIPSEILEEKTATGRAKIISAYIQVAAKLYTGHHNYNSLKAVLAGLQSTPIYRLKKTWKEVPSKKRKRFEQLCGLMSEADNWQLYRGDLDRQVHSDTSFIPFLGQFLTQVVQTDSYNQARIERNASESPSETPSRFLSPTKERERKRSSSMDNNVPQSTSNQLPMKSSDSNTLSVDEGITLSVSAPVSPSHTAHKAALTKKDSGTSSDSDKNHSKSSSIDSSSSPLVSDDDDVDGQGDSTADSGHHSSISVESRPGIAKSTSHSVLSPHTSPKRSSQLELNQIYVSLQRRSQSYDNLLNSYTAEDPGLRDIVHTTLNELSRLSLSMHSLADSVFSDEESDQLTQSLNTSSRVDSDQDHTSDYGSDINTASIESTKSLERNRFRPRRILFRAQSDNNEACALSPDTEECCADQNSENQKKVRRSKSCTAKSANKRRRHNKKAKSETPTSESPKTTAEMLNSFQVASLKSSIGVKENSILKTVICESETNSESLSFKISVEREAREVQ